MDPTAPPPVPPAQAAPGPQALASERPMLSVQQEPSMAQTAPPPVAPTPATHGSQTPASVAQSLQLPSAMQVPATRAPARARAPEPPPKPQRPKIKIRMTERAMRAMAAGRPTKSVPKVHPAAAKPGPAASAGAGTPVLDADRACEDAEAGRLEGIGQGVPQTVRPQQADEREGTAGGMDAVRSAIMRQVCAVLGIWAQAQRPAACLWAF